MLRTTGWTAAAAAGLGVAATGTSWAALPPYWQSAREIAAIVGDPRVHDALAYEEPIVSVSTGGDDVYVLKTARCTLPVTVVDKPAEPGLAGPRQFDLEIGDAECE